MSLFGPIFEDSHFAKQRVFRFEVADGTGEANLTLQILSMVSNSIAGVQRVLRARPSAVDAF